MSVIVIYHGKIGSRQARRQAATVNIEEYYMVLHPEIRESQEWIDQGRCPACGHHVGTDAKECPDCGVAYY